MMPFGADPVGPEETLDPDSVLCPDTVLCQTAWCRPRELPAEHLVYDLCAGEQHLISPLGRYLYLLCDGMHTVGEITDLAGPAATPAVREQLAELVARGLIEPLPAGSR